MADNLDDKPSRASLDQEKSTLQRDDSSTEDLPADPDAHLSPEEKAALVL